MKITIILLAIIGVFSGLSAGDKEFLAKQKFLFEIVHRVEDPLAFEEWTKLGKSFTFNKNDYQLHSDTYLEKFYESFKRGSILRKGAYFSALTQSHLKQANGLFHLFYYAKNWQILQRNIAWARMNCNEGMFVNALTLAVKHCKLLHGLVMPTINQIFPKQFFNSKFIYEVAQYESIYDSNRITNDTQEFHIPVGYSPDIEFFNKESEMAYFYEDVGLNTYWYNFNLDFSFALDKSLINLRKDRGGEFWLFNVRQHLNRQYFERLSHGFDKINKFSFTSKIDEGYNPQLVSTSGISYQYRKNNEEFETSEDNIYYNVVTNFFKQMDEMIFKGSYETYDGKKIDFRKSESIEFLARILQGKSSSLDDYILKNWNNFAHMYMADVNVEDFEMMPNVALNYETMNRDPLFYKFHKKIANVYHQFVYFLQPHTNTELSFNGVKIEGVSFSKLATCFEASDFEVSNLLKAKMAVKTLYARQEHLKHIPFSFELNVESNLPRKAVVRTFLAPKNDEFGNVIAIEKNRENFMEIDKKIVNLKSGINKIKRNSSEFSWTSPDEIPSSKLYESTILALEGKQEFPFNISESRCGFPNRMILSRGWKTGMPMQFYFIVTPYNPLTSYEQTYTCGSGSSVYQIDDLPFGYPFDRQIDEGEFYVDNSWFKDELIYHLDKCD